MYQFSPIAPRVARIRKRYRDTKPKVCIERFRLVTEFYQDNPTLPPMIKRAKNLAQSVREDARDRARGRGHSRRVGLHLSRLGALPRIRGRLAVRRDQERRIPEPHPRPVRHGPGRHGLRHAVRGLLGEERPQPLDRRRPASRVPRHRGQRRRAPSATSTRAPDRWATSAPTTTRPSARASPPSSKRRRTRSTGMKGRLYGDRAEREQFYYAVTIVCDAAITLSKRYAAECRRQAAGVHRRGSPGGAAADGRGARLDHGEPGAHLRSRPYSACTSTRSSCRSTATCTASPSAASISTWTASTKPIWPPGGSRASGPRRSSTSSASRSPR